ncbi:TonB-dependent receptor [Parashewanella tropica]|uniref:TonB-dependent receptor n=1 Tax=Parashewanella tropica TaxID=2547970 RepID=UPI0010596B00|nr:TonB-dependent receptor [Parashewanella tropica]
MKTRNRKISSVALALCMAYGLAAPAMADTASNMRGHITNASGVAVTDVTVSIVHEPTGSITKVKVDGKGNFSARGLRVGGPYKIILDSESLADDTIEGVYLNVGETFRLNRSLSNQEEIESITVSASSQAIIGLGDSQYYGAKAIENSPGLDRDLKDTLRQNPFANLDADGISLSVAGMNPRYNSFVVDGIQQNDDFGLNSNGYPTQRSPISIDAVQSVALDTAPFSARRGGFTGAQINVTTKSGTNEVDGTLFWQNTNDSLAGDGEINGKKVKQDFKETTFGGTIGLPIIKDKLFFFGSYEKFDAPQKQLYGPAGTGFANASPVTKAQFDDVVAIAKSKYGLNNIGSFDATPVEEDEKLILKLDWEINNDHRASLTYQNTDGNRTSATSDDENLNLSSHTYNKNEKLETFGLNVYSDWSDVFSTEIKVAHKDTTTSVSPITPLNIGSVRVQTDAKDSDIGINFGTERFRQANELNNQKLEISFAGDYVLGDHILGFGFNYSDLKVYNLFAADFKGRWVFNSIEDFRAGKVGNFTYNNAKSKNRDDIAAKFDIQNIALWAEDVWTVNDDLELQFGLRYETISMDKKPELNSNFVKRYNFANNHTLDGLDIWLPRAGFNYTLTDNVTLRGGIGRYTGGSPNVWIANSFSNDGVTLLSYRDGWKDSFGKIDFSKVPQGADDAIAKIDGDGDVNAIAPNFELPSDWRFNLAADTTWDLGSFGENWFFGTEILYIKRENDLAWKDLARRKLKVDGTGRQVYETWDPLANEGKGGSTKRRDILLTNADKSGRSFNWSLTTAKAWDFGLDFRLTYTYSDVKEGFPGTSSRAVSNYQYAITRYDRNEPTLGTGNFETPHRFSLTMGYETEFFAGYNSRFNLFYNIKKGRPLSWVLGSHNDKNLGDQSGFSKSDAYLPYIPTGPNDPNVKFEGDLTYDQFLAAIKKIGLDKYAGKIIPKGTSNQPWTHQLDFKFAQEVPGFTSEHKGEFYFTIRNVLNLINKDWGRVETQRFNNKILVDHDYDAKTGVYTYKLPYRQDSIDTRNYNTYNVNKSTWQMQVGVKYKF